MKPETADNLLRLAVKLDLVSEAAAEEAFRAGGGESTDIAAFGQTLVRRELLTGYQLERLLRGETTGYFYGRAKVLYQVGAGAFARVYRAAHRDTGGMLAVKVLRKRFSDNPAKQAAFQREGEMGRTLRHPHIVAVEDVGQDGGSTYLTLEFIEGQTLRQLVKIRGAIDLPRALDLTRQMLSGLDYAHRRGVTDNDPLNELAPNIIGRVGSSIPDNNRFGKIGWDVHGLASKPDDTRKSPIFRSLLSG